MTPLRNGDTILPDTLLVNAATFTAPAGETWYVITGTRLYADTGNYKLSAIVPSHQAFTPGDDWITVTEANAYWRGGQGIDMLSFILHDEGVHARLDRGSFGALANIGLRQFDGFESFTGTSHDDVFVTSGHDRNGIAGMMDGPLLRLRGMYGDDWMGATADATRYEGGRGADTVSYEVADGLRLPSGVDASLLAGQGWTGFAAGDSYEGVEALEGSRLDDLLIGDHGDNTLTGGFGSDTLMGNGGDDVIEGGDDFFDDLGGYLFIHTDVARFGFARSAYSLTDLGGGRAEVRYVGPGPVDGTDTVTGIEILRFADMDQPLGSVSHSATAAAEHFAGGLFGDHGDNILRGGEGDDLLIANAGRDILYGGPGVDVAVFSYDRDQYFVGQYSLNHVVSHTGAGEGDGLNTLYGVEILRFADGDVIL